MIINIKGKFLLNPKSSLKSFRQKNDKIIDNIIRFMFPEITKNKKKPLIGTEQMRKEWDQLSKQLDHKAKIAAKKFPPDIIADFNKVCRLKEIPDFYSHYFVFYTQRASPQQYEVLFNQEIEKIMTNNSYYHHITSTIKSRAQLLHILNENLHIAQGFYQMNQGKAIPTSIKNVINDLLKDCTNLQDVKKVEDEKIKQLAKNLNQIRQNARKLLELNQQWQIYLQNLDKSNLPSIKKMKVIFPNNGINCVFDCLYDTENVRKSFLKKQLQFFSGPKQKQRSDPFFRNVTKGNKRETNFQKIFLEVFNQNSTDYLQFQTSINSLIPLTQAQLAQKKDKRQDKKEEKVKQKKQELIKQKMTKSVDNKSKNHGNLFRQVAQRKTARDEKIADKDRLKSSKAIINIDKVDQVYRKKKKKKQEKKERQISESSFSIEPQQLSTIKEIISAKKRKNTSLKKQQLSKSLIADQSQGSIKLPYQQKITFEKIDKISQLQAQKTKLQQKIIQIQKQFDQVMMNKQQNQPKEIQNELLKKRQSLGKQLNWLEKKISQSKLQSNENASIIKEKKMLMDELKKTEKEKMKMQLKFEKEDKKKANQNSQLKKKLQMYQQQLKELTTQRESQRKQKVHQQKQSQLSINKIYKVEKSPKINPQQNLYQDLYLEEKQERKSIEKELTKIKKQKNIIQVKLGKSQVQIKKKQDNNAYNFVEIKSQKKKLQNQLNEIQNQLQKLNILRGQSSSSEQIERINLEVQSLVKKKIQILKQIESKNQQLRNFNSRVNQDFRLVKHDISQLKNQNTKLNKQLALAQKQKIKIQNIMKKQDTKLSKQNNLLKLKLSHFKDQMDELKNKYQEQKKVKTQRKPNLNDSSVSYVYQFNQNKDKNDPKINELADRFNEERQQKKNLQRQIKQLQKEKIKIQQLLSMSEGRVNKEKQMFEKKINKYQEVIEKLKVKQSNKAQLSLQKNNNKRGQSLRMYTTSPVQELKQKKKDHPEIKKDRSMNLFHINKQKSHSNIAPKKYQISSIRQQQELMKKSKINSKDVQIIKTKKSIEIFFQNKKSKKKSLIQQSKAEVVALNKEFLEASRAKKQKEQELEQIKKQKNQLQRKMMKLQSHQGIDTKKYDKQMQNAENQINKYKQILIRERQKKAELQQKMRKAKHNAKEQYIMKLDKQRKKFEFEREQLIQKIQEERQEKILKEKYMEEQLKFLKQMQQNQKQLLQMLQRQKQQKKLKERQLAEQIERRQQLLSLIEIQQIKKEIEEQVRNQMEKYQTQQDEYQETFIARKQVLQGEIAKLKANGTDELDQIEKQNNKLKELIGKIKAEENKLLEAIKVNIQQQQNQQEDQQLKQFMSSKVSKQQQERKQKQIKQQRKNQKFKYLEADQELKKSKYSEQNRFNMQQALQQLKVKTDRTIQHDKNKLYRYQQLLGSPQYKEKQKVQNLVQFYLKNQSNQNDNHTENPISLNTQQKEKLVNEMIQRNKLATEFQKQLLQSNHIQKNFVPHINDDPILSYMMNLRDAYEQQQMETLRKQLFPPVNYQQQQFDQQELSVQSSQTPPPITILDHVQQHNKKYRKVQKAIVNNGQKNFLLINRMRVLLLQEDRKQRERLMIEQEGRRRAKQQALKQKLYQKSVQRKQELKKAALQQQQEAKKEYLKKKKSKSKQKKVKQLTSDQGQMSNISNIQKNEQNIWINKMSDLIPNQKSSGNEKSQKMGSSQNEFLSRDDLKKVFKNNITYSSFQDKTKTNYDFHKIQEQQEKMNEENQEKKQLQQNDQKKQEVEDNQDEYQKLSFHEEKNENQLEKQRIQREKQQLLEDIESYQQEIRSYISGEQQFIVYQQFVKESQLHNYLKQTIGMANTEIKKLNSNHHLVADIFNFSSVFILIAKNYQNLEIGIGIFHKDFDSQGQYVCDYLLAHDMKNFLNLSFNVSKYIFQRDSNTNKINFMFELGKVQDQLTLKYFAEFQAKCKRLGQVYVKVDSLMTRRYVLRRNLFEREDKPITPQGKGISFENSVHIHEQKLQQKGMGFPNSKDLSYSSATVLLAYYLKSNEQKLLKFKQKAQRDLKHRQLLITALLFQKKQAEIKNLTQRELSSSEKQQMKDKLSKLFYIDNMQYNIDEITFSIEHILPLKSKSCMFQMQEQIQRYTIVCPEQAVTKIQASNSSQTGTFMSTIPKYKLLFLPADQYLRMHEANQDLTVFFYVKHFIKNIVNIEKQNYSRVYIPEVNQNNQYFLKETSDKMKQSLFVKQNIKIGWPCELNNSVLFQPHHKDLVIKRPFIVSLLAGSIQRVVQGSPICVSLIE